MGQGGRGRCQSPLTPWTPFSSSPNSAEVDVWNPAFDVTPHELITGGIITERGLFAASEVCGELAERGER